MKMWVVLAMLFVVTSCASYKEEQEKVRTKVSQENISSGQELNTTLHEVINHSKTLTDEQKEKLRKIVDDVRAQNQALQEETLRLRLVLIRELISENVSQKEVKVIKKNIVKAEDMRMKNTFRAINEITQIVKKDPDSEAYVNHMMAIDRPIR